MRTAAGVTEGPIRVTGGEWRGTLLFTPPGLTARPALSRVRGALFNIFGPLDGATVLDFFAGTGALGFEALSRGAARAVFFERDGDCLEAIRRSAAKVRAGERARVEAGDVAAGLERVRGLGADLAFVDPPYALIDGEESRPGFLGFLAALPAGGAVRPGGLVCVEHRRGVRLDPPPGYEPDDRREWGQTAVTFLRTGGTA